MKHMNAIKMSTNLFTFACNVIDSLEEILATSLQLNNYEIYARLEENLGYSLAHIRDVFKLATNISLTKYIDRRKYTNILLQMSFTEFDELAMNAKKYGIQKFKSKCLREFPELVSAYAPEHMQLPLEEFFLKDSLKMQIEKNDKEYFEKPFYKHITKGRIPFEIKDSSEKIIIQTWDSMPVDLEKTYFVFGDNIFKITATLDVEQDRTEVAFLSMLFEQPVCLSTRIPADANFVIQTLHQLLAGSTVSTNGFSIILDWGCKHGWRTSNLITSMFFDNDKLLNVEISDNPFLLFDNQNVILNLSFFDKNILLS